ncbi:Asp-tRNA(Asn)/Glu-tRNA(Gln) amidotransferase subunit GatC [Pectinatus cerevisiiphilus]|uniref:Aspartyl/glutamyl-tRNA(Asn/Gln) amidotransferase subunit C n=1 Tax=Pectinatus cerevisiiphilus TaxID=86956 RepID=A0A4R3KCT2_9FIRM|nr:Asp-tRNA(Asn)/Glu-tRNA(Gln) amidotransferase subunit GatC [Pectinatus cerevisiiphilus]TCS80928.1 aspartyl/glutamyl-tRNA(Asn/Gln) amidotransferase subunit C [Pectinatus cerevisiiphilus]
MKVSKKDVENVAVLSRLKIADDKMDKYLEEFNNFLEYVDVLQKVDTENVKPTAHVLPLQNVFREDVIKPSLDREKALANAPEKENGYFKVPRIIE